MLLAEEKNQGSATFQLFPEGVNCFDQLTNPNTRRSFFFEVDKHCQLGPNNYQQHGFGSVVCSLGAKNGPHPSSSVMGTPKKMSGNLVRSFKSGRLKQNIPLVFVTACQIAWQDKHKFLEQFDLAANYMSRQKGLFSYRLYQATSQQEDYQFINLAHWSGIEDFIGAFQTNEFKSLIRGGFDQTSQIIVTHPLTKFN